MKEQLTLWGVRAFLAMRSAVNGLGKKMREECGQGTTEYAILVGVLVVIAIAAIGLFKPKLEELWQAIVDGMNAL